ncbi:hypothetical protein VSDG_05194 [Cytospora chrysosperma]|uniref:Phosphatidylethanolamine-binding protein n=1 Tax=Cytospora chrysosperma TaxID=252740 RepID=A0A423VXR5_CYTCH|nr:hypothetical protein VSDG_05194 [Valsa sordida]
MDEPCLAWPFWKFGLKGDDLNTTLHDRFNTVPSAIQDPEAFHHDVYELSTQACTLDEFERLMEERKQLRLKELNGMLENASFEIVGNPSLIGTEQWQYALQLFRTKSLDSLVRYFSSYLPQDHPWHHDFDSAASSNHGYDPILDCDGPIMFDEPEEDDDPFINESHPCTTAGVLSNQPVRSMTVRSEDSGVSVTDRGHKSHNNHTSDRAMTFFKSEPGHAAASLESSVPSLHDYEGTSQSDDPETPSTSISDLSDVDEESHGKDILIATATDDDGSDAKAQTRWVGYCVGFLSSIVNGQGVNDRQKVNGGPKRPLGYGVHRYFYTLVALDEPLDTTKLSPVATKKEIGEEIKAKMVGWGLWIALYERKWENREGTLAIKGGKLENLRT